MEDGEEEEMKEEKEEEEEEEKNEKVVQLWSPEKLRRDYITSDPSATRGPSGKVTVHEGHININDAEFDPDFEVTEFNQVKTHPRPLQRARSRYEARTGNTPWKNRHIGADHHLSDLSQGTQEQWEQERVYHRCDRCNNQLTDTDWSKLKSEGWVFGIVKHCSPCIDSMARAPDQSTRPHELTDVE